MRIEARRLDDGRIEFALRERGGERILPPKRYFPAETEAGRWLNASWITVGASDEFAAAPPPAATPPPALGVWKTDTSTDDLTGETRVVYSVATKWDDSGRRDAPVLAARCDPETGLNLIVNWYAALRFVWNDFGRGSFAVDGGSVQARCSLRNGFELFVTWDRHITTSASSSQRSSITGRGSFAVDRGSVQEFAWRNSTDNNATFAAFPEQVADWLRNGSDRIVIRVYNYDGESLTATFPIGGYAQSERANLGCR